VAVITAALASCYLLSFILSQTWFLNKQEAQLMLTNLCDAFRGHSRSPNIVGMVRYFSYCAIVTLSLKPAVYLIFDFKKFCDPEIRVIGHSRSLIVVPFYRLGVVSYSCSIETLFVNMQYLRYLTSTMPWPWKLG